MVCAAVAAPPVEAQISPGELSEPHALLEGSTRCLECHEPGEGVSRERCLVCHGALGSRIAAGKGLHARPEYRRCDRCHVEHHGREVELVYWGEEGRGAFDHGETGYTLEGRHAGLDCERCHRVELLQQPAALSRGGSDPGRTFLGLETGCSACHEDAHAGQLGTGCAECHTQESWKPAVGFDHARTRYALTGRHATVSCSACHPPGPTPAERVYRGVAFGQCSDCHRDVHQGRLGAHCSSCHRTDGWAQVSRDAFDHDRTAYPLRGRHASVACQRCHRSGQSLRLRHERCSDCHADPHRGSFARRADGGRCESCHDVEGFEPVRFGLDDHQETGYPLLGAHRAVPCDRCHRRPSPAAPARYRFESTQCRGCHADPHQGAVERWMSEAGCEACHRVESWRVAAFDHAATRFPLEGRHEHTACVDCHPRQDPGEPGRLRWVGPGTSCESCHRDPHEGQLSIEARTRCERCHSPSDWRASRFDHQRDATYQLDGAHLRVPCAGCHPTEAIDGRAFVRYKPLASDCRDCHAGREGGT